MRIGPILAAIFLVCSFETLGEEPPEADAKRAGAVLNAILDAVKATHNLRYRAEIKVIDDTGQAKVQTEEFETMERFRLTTSDADIILLPNGAWVRFAGEDEWLDLEAEQASKLKRLPALLAEGIRNSTGFVDEGATTWQGQPAHAYRFDTNTTIEGARVDAHTTLYLNQAGVILGSESDNVKNGHKFRKVQKNTYDPAIHIEVPRSAH